MRRKLGVLAGAMVAMVTVTGVYALVPVPMDGLGKAMPHPWALAKYEGRGCGTSSFSSASVTKFYQRAKLDVKTRQALDAELLADGFVKRETAQGLSYRKPAGGWMPTTSSVTVRADGSFSCGATRRKWAR